ncbi:TIGR03086 family metal-binding protein [Actinomycetospora chlora]|uniref:TIGR03086 family metal-binding protein n=1 Tax=Actinomycetospora chlora TaxID=663608 RepID=UPI0031E74F16
MTADARELLPAAIDRFGTRVHAVGDDRWAAPTPCASWSVADLVGHLCFEHLWAPHELAGTSMEQVGDRYEGDLLHDDPAGAWDRAAARSRPRWTAVAEHAPRVHTIFGWIPVAEYAEQMLLDLTVHEWDLARGAGLDERVDPDAVGRALAYLDADPVMLTGPGLFADPVPARSDGPQDRLLARLGRRVR